MTDAFGRPGNASARSGARGRLLLRHALVVQGAVALTSLRKSRVLRSVGWSPTRHNRLPFSRSLFLPLTIPFPLLRHTHSSCSSPVSQCLTERSLRKSTAETHRHTLYNQQAAWFIVYNANRPLASPVVTHDDARGTCCGVGRLTPLKWPKRLDQQMAREQETDY